MSCFIKQTYQLRAGNRHEYRKDLGDPRKLTTQTYYVLSGYGTHNTNWSYGISRYNSMKAHIEYYTGYNIGCVHVNDLGATYNALNEVLGISDRALNPAEITKLQAERIAASYKKYGNPVNVSKSRNQEMLQHHQLQGRGVSGGRVLINVQEIKQRTQELAEEKLLQDKLEKQKIENEIKRQENLRLMELEKQKPIIEIQPEIIPAVVATSSLIPLAIIAFLLINSRKDKK